MEEQARTDFFSSLLIVLVIYKMKLSESLSYQSLTTALRHYEKSASLFVYDNSPTAQQLTTDQCWNSIYLHDPSNAGVSKAYNEGFKKAKELNKKWMLLVDQDTGFPVSAFESYTKSIIEFKNQIVVPILKDKLGIVSPFKFYFGGGQRIPNLIGNKEIRLHDFFFHNSGLLISVDVFENAGRYDENLPLDFSDVSFVYRLRKMNDFFVLADFSCDHQLASSATATLHERLSRFASYVSSSKRFKDQYDSADWMLSFRVFLRSIKLCLRHGSFKFMIPIFKTHD